MQKKCQFSLVFDKKTISEMSSNSVNLVNVATNTPAMQCNIIMESAVHH